MSSRKKNVSKCMSSIEYANCTWHFKQRTVATFVLIQEGVALVRNLYTTVLSESRPDYTCERFITVIKGLLEHAQVQRAGNGKY